MTVHNLATGVTGLTSNAFLVEGATTALVDTGAGFDLVETIAKRGLEAPEHVVLTHTHPDHVDNVSAVVEVFDAPVYGHDPSSSYVTDQLAEGDTIDLGDDQYVAWYTPGHANDHLCLYSEAAQQLFSGDLIFPNGGVGRTDLPGCDPDALAASIERVYRETDDALAGLYAGHGPPVESSAYRHIEAAARFVGVD